MKERRIWNVNVSKMKSRDVITLMDDLIEKYHKENDTNFTDITEDERRRFFEGFWEPKDKT